MEVETPSVLRRILEKKRERLKEAKRLHPLAELKRAARDLEHTRDFLQAVGSAAASGEPPRIIAEFKRRSPSRGVIREKFDLLEIERAYREGGADGFSILTEEDFFGGRLEHLSTIKGVAKVPCLRKDFLFDPYQIYESRQAGADAFLLITAAITDSQIEELLGLGREMGMMGLVEVHSEDELERALSAGAALIGINNRDLNTFAVDVATTERLRPLIPKDRLVVSESGIVCRRDMEKLRQWGVDAALVGESLLSASDIAAKMKELLS